MYISLKPYTEALANGKFTANFTIFESIEDKVNTMPFYFEKQFDDELEAYEFAEKASLDYLNKNYPEGTKYKIEKSN